MRTTFRARAGAGQLTHRRDALRTARRRRLGGSDDAGAARLGREHHTISAKGGRTCVVRVGCARSRTHRDAQAPAARFRAERRDGEHLARRLASATAAICVEHCGAWCSPRRAAPKKTARQRALPQQPEAPRAAALQKQGRGEGARMVLTPAWAPARQDTGCTSSASPRSLSLCCCPRSRAPPPPPAPK